MAMINCQECGKEISDKAVSCPNCGAPLGFNGSIDNKSFQYQNNNTYQTPQPVKAYIHEQKKNSGIGIAALIFSIIGVTFFVGIILAVIDLIRKDGKKKIFSIVSLCICAFWLILAISVGKDDSKENQTYIKSDTKTIVQNDDNKNAKETKKSEEETKNVSKDYINITSTDLIDSYNENQVKCKQMYDGKMIRVTGKVDSVGTDIMGSTYVCLGHDTEFTFVGIQCYSKKDDVINQIAELKEGDVLTVSGKGECGSLSFSLKDIQIEKIVEETYVDESGSEVSDITIGQKNALSQAKSYLEWSAMSYDGLIKQLEYEEYSHDEAVFAADNCGADWNEQAVKQAKSYLEFSSFSKESLIEQLEYEGFTHEQAIYGAEKNGY